MKVDVTTMLLRDGTIYFFALLTVNVTLIATASTTASYISPFLTNLTPVLIARFMLNLRDLGSPPPSEDSFSRFSAPAFYVPPSMLAGNLGADLDDLAMFSTDESAAQTSGTDDSAAMPDTPVDDGGKSFIRNLPVSDSDSSV
ncbi:hypothetical protein PsYK624_123650 [Phanerochaete sordida]|uniref:Uncharacterized protein n=1 Tax=Phanerochaete sordida TaxID=48140 RepID=A0A9P3GIG3_9APHY|nr:hypothetical protein PsYK624_123650 [Phanerochaete sordida]